MTVTLPVGLQRTEARSQPPPAYWSVAQHLRRRPAADLHVAGDPDAEQLAVAAAVVGLLLLAQLVVADQLLGLVHGGRVVARVVLQRAGRHPGLVEGRDEVHRPDLGRVLADPAGERVHDPLGRIGRLGPAGAPVGVGRGLVGEHRGAGEAVGVAVVDAVVVEGAQDRDARPDQGRVGAHVGLELDPHAEQLALLGGGHLHVLDHAAALDGGQVALGAVLVPLDRLAELAGQGDGDELLGVDLQLGAEAAADLGGDHPDLGLGDAEDEGQEHPQEVRDLGRRPDGELAAGPAPAGPRWPRGSIALAISRGWK